MSKHGLMRLLASLMLLLSMLVLGLSSAEHVYAQDKGTGSAALPEFKQPGSARFDIAGSVRSSGLGEQEQTITISGHGAMSGADFEQTYTYELPAEAQVEGQPSSFTLEVKVVQGKYYMKIGGLLGEPSDQWYVMDAPAVANSGALPDLSALGSDFTVTEEGRETLNGAPTTKYRVDIDVSDLLGDLDGESASAPGNSFTMALYLWKGDADQYLHKYNMVLDLKSSFELDAETRFEFNIAMDLSLTFKDFDTPVTITAPENAVPFDASPISSMPSGTGVPDIGGLSGLAGVVGTVSSPAGMPMGMPVNVPISAPPTAPSTPPEGTGMPRTGASSQESSLVWILIALALGTLCLGASLKLTRGSNVRI